MSLVSREFVKDRFSLILVSVGFLLTVINVLFVVLKVSQKDFDIPVRYTQYGASPIVLGEWYTLYELAIFAIIASAVNIAIALKLHKNRRQLSIAVLIGQILIMIFLLLVARAILGFPAVS